MLFTQLCICLCSLDYPVCLLLGIPSTLTGEEDGYDEAQVSTALNSQVGDSYIDLDQSQWPAQEFSNLPPQPSPSTDAYMCCSSPADVGGKHCEISQAYQ